MESMLNALRGLRDRHQWLRPVHLALRRPYYMLLERMFPRGVAAKLASGEVVRLHPRLLGIRPEAYEIDLTRLLVDHAVPGAIVVDVGAHVGLHVLTLSRLVGAAGRVIAVEPSPANARLLRSHLEWNNCSNVTVIEALAGDRPDNISFGFRPDPTDPGSFANSLAYDIGGKRTLVPMRTIDEMCDGLSPQLIKIDVEGAELIVLRGAARTLERAAPTLVVAIHPSAMPALGTFPKEIFSFLAGLGYAGRHLDGRVAHDAGFEEIIFTPRTRSTPNSPISMPD